MRVYVVLDLQTRNIYGITDELWLAKLFYVQRNRFLNNLFILRRKDKYLTKRGLSNHDLKINYLSGYAVLNYELEFIESEMVLAGFTYFKYRYSKVFYRAEKRYSCSSFSRSGTSFKSFPFRSFKAYW